MTEYLKSENSTVPDDPYLYVLDQVPLHISLIDLDLNVVWANKKALESEHLLLENKCFLGFNSDMEQCTFCPVVRAISSLNTEVSMVEISDEKDESDKVYEITAIPYLNSSGLLKGVYEIRKDVSLQLNKQHKSIETKSNNRKNKEEGFSTEHLFDIISNELREHTESAIKTHNRLNTRKLTNDQKLGLVGIKTSL